MTSRGYNTTESQAKLNEIIGKRSDLEAALAARNQTQIHAVNVQILGLSNDLRTIVRNLQIHVPQTKKVQYWILVGGRVINRTATIIQDLATLGVNVSQLQQFHTQAQQDLRNATIAWNLNNTHETINALHAFKADLIALRNAFHDLINSGRVTGDTKTTVENLTTALDDTTNELGNSI